MDRRFSGFTPKEYEVISALLENASQVQVALCLDRDELRKKPDSTRLFYPTRKTHDEISMLAWKSGVTIDETIYLEDQNIPRFAYSPELACLEKQFRGKSYNQKEIQEQSGVFLISAANPHAEGEFVAREILRLVRDEGLRYKDITVELRELGGFADLLSLIFKDYGIPYFLDRKSSVAHHPLAELVRSAIDMYLTGFSFEAVFRYLKTDLVPVTREEVDILENYVLKHGIKGEHWISQQPWHFSNEYFRDDEVEEFEKEMSKEMDEIRKKAMSSYAVFYKSLKKEEKQLTARHVSHLLRCLLDDLNVYDILEKWSFSDSMHMGVWDKLTEILDQATEILGDHPVDMSTYSVLINAGLEDIRLGLIPPSLDQLLIGSFDRSRQPDCKVTFLMGAVEGLIPARAKEDCIFTDDERDYLSGLGINLEAGSASVNCGKTTLCT